MLHSFATISRGIVRSGLVSAGLLGALVLASPALAAVATIPINDGNVPTTAGDFETISCDNIPPAEIADNEDGWVFALPASAGADGNFISVTATFEDENGDQQVLNTGANGGIVSGSGDNKAYIISPAGWTLIDAEAEVENPDEGAFFNLTHTCPGKPGDSPTTPGEQATTPGGSPSAPGDQTTTAGGLPTTGASIAIVFALGLALAAGGVLIMILRRTRSQDS